MILSSSLAPLLLLLSIVVVTIGLVWLGSALYFGWKEAHFWANAERLADEPASDEERAALELYNLPDGTLVEFADPEGDPGAETVVNADDIKRDAEEMKFAESKRPKAMDYDSIPTGEVFTDVDGRQCQFVESPNATWRVKRTVGAVENPNKIPFPKPAELSRIMRRQSIETLDMTEPSMIKLTNEDRCEVCGTSADHNHSGAELRHFISDLCSSTFKKYVADMDLTQLPAEEVQKLWARCRARIEQDASASAMLALDGLFTRAQKLAEEDAEDEAFYRNTLKEAEAGAPPYCSECDGPCREPVSRYEDVDEHALWLEQVRPKAKTPKKPAKKSRKKKSRKK